MAKQQTSDRHIPHLRDIFGFSSNWNSGSNSNNKHDDALINKFQELNVDKKQTASTSSGNDSAISMGCTSDEDASKNTSSNNKKKKRSRRDNSRTLTQADVKHLERHLSMKKTIRKKIMRDLQQAFVEDPNEFRVENISPDKLKSEINIESISFGTPQHKNGKNKTTSESNFLDMLRGGPNTNPINRNSRADDLDSGHGSPTREPSSGRDAHYDEDNDEDAVDPCAAEEETNKKTSFWRRITMKGKNKR